jgi:hypothetical protein
LVSQALAAPWGTDSPTLVDYPVVGGPSMKPFGTALDAQKYLSSVTREKPHAFWDPRCGGWIVEWYGHPIGCFTTLAVAVGWFHDPQYRRQAQ